MSFRDNMMALKESGNEAPSKQYTPLNADEMRDFTDKVVWIQNGGLKEQYQDILEDFKGMVDDLKNTSSNLIQSSKSQLQTGVKQAVRDAEIARCVKDEIAKGVAEANKTSWIWKAIALMMAMVVWCFGLWELSRLWGFKEIGYSVIGFLCLLSLVCLVILVSKKK